MCAATLIENGMIGTKSVKRMRAKIGNSKYVILRCLIFSCHVNVVLFHVMSCHVMSCHVLPCHVMLCIGLLTYMHVAETPVK